MRINKKRLISLITIIALIIVFLLILFKNLINNNPEIFTVMDSEKYYDVDSGNGTILFNEFPIYLEEDVSNLKLPIINDRLRIDEKITDLNEEMRAYFQSIADSNKGSSNKGQYKNILDNIFSTNYGLINISKNYSDEIIRYSKDVLNKGEIFTYQSMYITDKLDGYESILNIDMDKGIYPDIYTDKKSNINGFKLVDNRRFYLNVKLNDDNDSYNEHLDESYSLRINGKKVNGKLVNINENNLIFELNTNFNDFKDIRSVDVGVIKNIYTVIKLPSSSIYENRGFKGVYIADKDGNFEFRPVEIVHENEDYVYVKKNGEELNYSIDYYEDIITNQKFIKEVIIGE